MKITERWLPPLLKGPLSQLVGWVHSSFWVLSAMAVALRKSTVFASQSNNWGFWAWSKGTKRTPPPPYRVIGRWALWSYWELSLDNEVYLPQLKAMGALPKEAPGPGAAGWGSGRDPGNRWGYRLGLFLCQSSQANNLKSRNSGSEEPPHLPIARCGGGVLLVPLERHARNPQLGNKGTCPKWGSKNRRQPRRTIPPTFCQRSAVGYGFAFALATACPSW